MTLREKLYLTLVVECAIAVIYAVANGTWAW